MNTYQSGFKSEILNTMFRLSGKIWLKITGAFAILYLITILTILAGFFALGISKNFSGISNLSTPTEIIEFYGNFFSNYSDSGKMTLFSLIIMVVMSIFGSWFIYFSFLLSKEQIIKDKAGFSDTFQKSFTNVVFQLIAAYLAIGILSFVFSTLINKLLTISGLLTFIITLLFYVFMNKFILVMPAIGIGKMSIRDAFRFSFEKITISRAFKLFGVFILIGIVTAIAFIILMLISMIFNFIPVLGTLIMLAIMIGAMGFIATFAISGLVGLYYRYIPEIDKEEEIDVDNLLVSE